MIETLYGVAIVPLIVAFVKMATGAGVPKKYGAVVSLVLGIAIGTAYGLTEAGWTVLECIIVGSAMGFSASGLYSGTKSLRRQS